MSSENQQSNSEIKSGAPAFPLRKLLRVPVLLVIVWVVALIYLTPFFADRSSSTREMAAKTQIAAFSTALDAFEVDVKYFPKGPNGLQDLVVQPVDTPTWQGPYMKEIPKDPWGHDYIYQYPGQHNTDGFDLSSMGRNGRAGDKDDITNWKRS